MRQCQLIQNYEQQKALFNWITAFRLTSWQITILDESRFEQQTRHEQTHGHDDVQKCRCRSTVRPNCPKMIENEVYLFGPRHA